MKASSDLLAGLATNILSGLIGALIAWGITEGARQIRRLKLQRQFPLGGRYISRYEDPRSDGTAIEKASANFTQRGLQLSGITTKLADGRTWHLKLTIEQSRYVHGVYDVVDPRVSSKGVVFLQAEPDGTLVGIWAGFHALNQRVEVGKYWFKRVLSFNVLDVYPGDHRIAEACALLQSELGDRYVSERDRQVLTAPGDDSRKFLVVAEHPITNCIVGAVLAEVADQEELNELSLEMSRCAANQADIYRLKNHRSGYIQAVAVDRRYRQNGIATELVRSAMQHLAMRGARIFYALDWVPQGERGRLQSIFETLDYVPLARFDRFWHERSAEQPGECPACGSPCECSATLLVTR